MAVQVGFAAMQGDGAGHVQHPVQHGDVPALGEQHPVHPARLQAGVNDGDFEDVDVVGVDDQRSVLRDCLQLVIVDAADQAGEAVQCESTTSRCESVTLERLTPGAGR